MESMNIHPTSGGVAPLYRPAKPSFRMVCARHCIGPLNWLLFEVCRRTLIVSKGWPTVFHISKVQPKLSSRDHEELTNSLLPIWK